MHEKLVSDPFLLLVNISKQPVHARNYFKNILKEDHQKALKKSTLFFLTNTVPFNGQRYHKQKGPGTSKQSLFRLQNKSRKIISYILFDQVDVIESGFWVIPKTASTSLCKAIYDIINCSTSICPSLSGNCGKEGKKVQKLEYLKKENSFLYKMKNTFHGF